MGSGVKNSIGHELVRIGRVDVKTTVWLGSCLDRVVNLCELGRVDLGYFNGNPFFPAKKLKCIAISIFLVERTH